MSDLKTILAPAEAEFTIQRSRFIVHTFPVKTEEAAQDNIRTIKKKYFDARHNCSAYRLGIDAAVCRSNDDGEPGGTAGAPILEAITRNDLTDMLIVVTRYFGGIKLGAGGLTRAYSHAAMLGINASPLAVITLFSKWTVTVPYTLLGNIENYLRQKELRTEEPIYAEKVSLKLLIKPEEEETIITDITNLTAAVARCERNGDLLAELPL